MKRAAIAIALYALFWLAALFGYLGGDLGEPLRALAVVAPALALGLYVNRWWAVAGGLVFLLAVPLPERSTIDGAGIDVTLTGTYDVSLTEALELIALTTPWVLIGVAARRYAATRASGGAAPEPADGTISEAAAPSGPS
jgi:hypothetical protein